MGWLSLSTCDLLLMRDRTSLGIRLLFLLLIHNLMALPHTTGSIGTFRRRRLRLRLQTMNSASQQSTSYQKQELAVARHSRSSGSCGTTETSSRKKVIRNAGAAMRSTKGPTNIPPTMTVAKGR